MPDLHRFSGGLWAVYLALVIISLVVKPSPYRPLLFAPILALTAYVLCGTTTGTFNDDYYLGLGWLTIFFFASDYIVFTDVQRELRQVSLNPASAPPDKTPIEHAPLWRRTRWAASLLFSPRGVGWAHEPTSALPPHPSVDTPRLVFVAQRLARTLGFFILHDACNLHVRWNDMYRPDGPGWTAYGWLWQFIVVAGWGLSAYSALMIGTSLLSAISVALGMSAPEEWPSLFGGPSEAWSIRRFWGRAWHQLIRRFVSVHGKYLAHKVLRLSPGGNASAYVQLYTAFLLSAAVHYGAETMALRHPRGGAFAFFMLQAVAITVEDFLFFLLRQAGVKEGRIVRWLGYTWTWAWFALVLPVWQMPLIRAGLMEEGLPVSVIAGLWRGDWALKPL
ncbi:membrane bound O-acyl transferase family-domain-containing protein [Mycena galericulata]|nr:membrane bound O-acyl transferase family-domain-containing protein [Mycena galericulata]